MKHTPDLLSLIGEDRVIVPPSEAPFSTGLSGWLIGDEQYSTHYLKSVLGYKEHYINADHNLRLHFWSKPKK